MKEITIEGHATGPCRRSALGKQKQHVVVFDLQAGTTTYEVICEDDLKHWVEEMGLQKWMDVSVTGVVQTMMVKQSGHRKVLKTLVFAKRVARTRLKNPRNKNATPKDGAPAS